MAVARPFMRSLPEGDGHRVIVLPGFMAPDASTAPLRRILLGQGHDVVGWGLGVNTGPRPTVVAGLEALMRDGVEETGRPVSLVGWSLGGMYARMLARSDPDRVRTVVTFASPFRMVIGDRSRASRLYRTLEQPEERHMWRAMREPPLEVPATSLFTKSDGVVDWRACVDEDRPQAESIEVVGASHFGMGHHPAAVLVVADRLATDPIDWRRFEVPVRMRRLIRQHDQSREIEPAG